MKPGYKESSQVEEHEGTCKNSRVPRGKSGADLSIQTGLPEIEEFVHTAATELTARTQEFNPLPQPPARCLQQREFETHEP